jgi:hypothetical protein
MWPLSFPVPFSEDENFHILSVGDDGVGVKKYQYDKIFQGGPVHPVWKTNLLN